MCEMDTSLSEVAGPQRALFIAVPELLSRSRFLPVFFS
jgi:hypothetical protein